MIDKRKSVQNYCPNSVFTSISDYLSPFPALDIQLKYCYLVPIFLLAKTKHDLLAHAFHFPLFSKLVTHLMFLKMYVKSCFGFFKDSCVVSWFTGLEPAVFAALVPNSADKPLEELIEEIMGDHEMLVSPLSVHCCTTYLDMHDSDFFVSSLR